MSTYETLRERLKEERYPHIYFHKFVGINSILFMEEVAKWQAWFPYMQLVMKRLSREGKYISYTFSFEAESADQIIHIVQATSLLQDIKTII